MSVETIKANLTDINEFEIIWSGYGAFPALSVSASAGNFNSGEAQTTIAHNLGYTPGLVINIANGSGNTPFALPCPYENNNVSASAGIWGILQVYVDELNVILLSDLMVYGNTTGNVVANTYIAQIYLVKERIKRLI